MGGFLLEHQLLEEFRQRLLGDTEVQLEDSSGEKDALAFDVALSEVILGDIEEAGALAEHETCAYEDKAGRNRCRVVAYSLPEEATRLDLVTAAFVPADQGEYLPNEKFG